jgi:hypothetical protein
MTHTIVAVSDLHGVLPAIPPCDLLLLGGDLCPTASHHPPTQAQWLDGPFRTWLADAPARAKVYIAGNHDFVFERTPELVPGDLPGIYLQDSMLEWEGLKIWGTPWQPRFFDWAFNLDEPELRLKWALIPTATDVILVHGPPLGYGDAVPSRRGVRQTGSPSLLERIDDIKPRLVVFGHIHEGRGVFQRGRSVLANVTLLDVKYQQVYEPWVYQLPDT